MLTRRETLRPLLMPLLAASGCTSVDPIADGLVAVQPGTLPIVICAPHGGRQRVPGADVRSPHGAGRTDTRFVTGRDPETDRLAQGIAAAVHVLTGRQVHLVVALFDRRFIDANRPLELAFDSASARPIYEHYHRSIRHAVDQVRSRHQAGLLIDVHGQTKFPDALVRGTLNGRSVSRLLGRAGFQAVTGPRGLFGQLERHGFRVFPGNDLPPEGRHEDAGFNGGHTTDRYGSHRPDGIDAAQFEFGSTFRSASRIDGSIQGAAAAIVDFHGAYLR
jgi:N-formylglutamate amidohydrolase